MAGDRQNEQGEAAERPAGAVLPAKLKGHYDLTFAEYSPRYGLRGDRTIKRWVSLGRHAVPVDLPPLDDPAKMPDWFSRLHPGREVPLGIRQAAARAGRPATSTSVPAAPTPRTSPPTECKGLTFPEQVAELRKIAEQQLNELRAVIGEQPPAEITDPEQRSDWARSKSQRIESAQKSFRGLQDALRKSESDLLDWQKEHAVLVPMAELGPEVGRIIGAIHAGVKDLVRKVRPQLRNKADSEQDDIWKEETRRVFRILKNSKFANAVTLDAVAT